MQDATQLNLNTCTVETVRGKTMDTLGDYIRIYKMTICFLLFLLNIRPDNARHVNREHRALIDTPMIRTTECNGAVTLYEGSKKIVLTENEDLRPGVVVDKVVVEGCGCFTVHTRRRGYGRLFFFRGAGEWRLRMTVKSIRKIPCYLYL